MTKAKFGSLLLLFQGILLILFVVFVDYGEDILPDNHKYHGKAEGKPTLEQEIEARGHDRKFPVFQDLHVMAFLGFGLIMTFLRRYSRGMLVHSFLIAGLVIQWATLLQGFFVMKNVKVNMNLDRMIGADFAVMTVLVSFGAVMGKCNSLQLLMVGLFETLFFAINEALCKSYLEISDHGGSITVHVFGAFFGIALSGMIFSRKVCMSQALSMSNKSEMYSFIGTLFLFVYWPSINASFADGAAQHRAIANTYYALSGSCISAFSFTVLQSKEGKFNVLHLQNATIAGGVAVGAVAAMMLRPWGALIIGIVGSLSSVLGYKYLVPTLRRKLHIHDTRGIVAAHALPGIVSAIASVVAAFLADEHLYKTSLYDAYPARTPKFNTTRYNILIEKELAFKPGLGRSALTQAVYQLAGFGLSIVLAVVGGIITGLVIRIKFFEPVSVDDAFDDHIDFEEVNCIDISSEPEYDDDEEEKHHDSVRGKKRLLDEDHHSDIALTDRGIEMTRYENKHGSMQHSIGHSHHSLNTSNHSLGKSNHSVNKSNHSVNRSIHSNTHQSSEKITGGDKNEIVGNGLDVTVTSENQALIAVSENA